MTLTGAVDGVAFESYVQEVLCPQLRPGQVVILDRLSVHRRKEVRETIEARGCELLFLPSYSLDLNPIELAFSNTAPVQSPCTPLCHSYLCAARSCILARQLCSEDTTASNEWRVL